MKKVILMVVALGIMLQGSAQSSTQTGADSLLDLASTFFDHQSYEHAKECIDKAVPNAGVCTSTRALFLKASIYLMLQINSGPGSTNRYPETMTALYRIIDLASDHKYDRVSAMLATEAILYFNDGVVAYNDKHISATMDKMKTAIKICDLRRFGKLELNMQLKLDTVRALAVVSIANAILLQDKYDDAIPFLSDAKGNKLTSNAAIYQLLFTAYDKTGKKAEELALLQEAEKLFPNDTVILNMGLNYYILWGTDAEKIQHFEEAVLKEPNSGIIAFNMALQYMTVAFTKKDGQLAPNASELASKAVVSFKKAVRLEPNNPEFSFNYGALYFNMAIEYNTAMNAADTTPAGDKTYAELKAKRDELFTSAMPLFEKTCSLYETHLKELNAEDKKTYKNTLSTLMSIYPLINMQDKVAKVKSKYDGL